MVSSIIGYLLMVGGLVGLILRHQVLSPSPAVIAVQVAALLLMAWARATFGRRSFHLTATPTEGGLVRTGPYRWIRHPIYAAVCLFVWGCFLGHPSSFAVAMAALTTMGAIVRMLVEEKALRLRYPEYDAYARVTKRVIPFVV